MPSTFNEPSAKSLLLGQIFQKIPKKAFVGSQPQKINSAKFHTKRKDAPTTVHE
jgi:hypothetical protein